MKIGICGPVDISALRDHLALPYQQSVPDLIGLGGTPVVHLVRELLRRNRRVELFTLAPEVTEPLILRGPDLTIYVGPYRKRRRARDLFAVERAHLKTSIDLALPDIVHAHWTYEFALGALSASAPVLVTAHDAPVNIIRHDHSPYRIVRTAMALKTARRAPVLTGVSPYVIEHWKTSLRFGGECHIVPNGLPMDTFAVERDLQRPPNKTTFACVIQGWSELKNSKAALRAFRLTRRQYPSATLLMFGSDFGPGEVAYQWAKQSELEEGVHFVGHLPYPELIERLASDVDILIHPSREEACPMAVIEALALGIPAIGGSSSGGVPFVVSAGVTGLLVDIDSPEAISRAMNQFIRDPDMKQSYGLAAKREATERFGIASVTDAYEALYERVQKKESLV